ncbi:hypothetical protein F3K24_43485, partial [Streptomyces sp. LBUM 1485]|nr:hypothetical protein [Streptomyces sp. LBUM 1485]
YQAISRYERNRRGPYAGAVLKVGEDGAMDAALVLRSVYAQSSRTWLRAGAGIVERSTRIVNSRRRGRSCGVSPRRWWGAPTAPEPRPSARTPSVPEHVADRAISLLARSGPMAGGDSTMLTVRECLSVQLLGPVRAWRGDTEVVLGPPKQRAVLALLADRAGDVVSIEHIIDAVWGSDVPQTAANGVHTYVAGLRRVLDPGRSRRGSSSVLVSAAGGYCLRVSPDVVDLTRFTRCHAQARRARAEGDLNGALKLYQECLSLWRGEAYGGIPGPHAAMERTRLQDLRMTVVEEWA